MFSSFSIRDFRIYLIGMFVSMCGTWIQTIAQSWLVFELSNSSFLLGLTGFVSYLPILLLSLFSGVLVDRINRRNILLFTQILFMISAFLLAIFAQLKIITVNFILFISLLNGIILSIDAPARQTIIVELVGKPKILNAIALNSVAFHLARVLGPALAGMLIATMGITGCFYINAISFLAFIIALLLINPKQIINNSNNYFLGDLRSGLKFIRDNRIYLILMGIVGVVSLFGFSYVILMPVVAKNIFNLGVKGYGLFMAATGVGSLLAGLMLAGFKIGNLQSKILVFSIYTFSISLMIFALSKSLILSIFILAVAGFSILSSLTIINSLIQAMVPDEFRGRIMSVYMLTFAGTMPIGSLLAGSLSYLIGVGPTLFLFGLACFISFLFLSNKIKSKEFMLV